MSAEAVKAWSSWLHALNQDADLQPQSLHAVCEHHRDLVTFIGAVKPGSVYKIKNAREINT